MLDHRSEIEQAIQNDLTPEDRVALERASDLYRGKIEGVDLDNWLAIGLAHNVHVRLALRLAQTNKRSGSIHTKYLHQIMRHHGIDDRDKKLKSILTALAWLCDDAYPERQLQLAEARTRMTPGELATLNSPHTARKLVKKLLDRQSGAEPPPPMLSPLAKMVERNRDLSGVIEDLNERLARSESGSLFNRNDEAKSVVAVIVRSQFSLGKLKAIEEGIRAYRLEQAKDTALLPKVKS